MLTHSVYIGDSFNPMSRYMSYAIADGHTHPFSQMRLCMHVFVCVCVCEFKRCKVILIIVIILFRLRKCLQILDLIPFRNCQYFYVDFFKSSLSLSKVK